MKYEVLARKWRPQTFDDVVGQDHITHTLKKAVEMGRISHAYLFAGPRGCGKTSTARILAKVINCTNLQKGNPCDACDSCRGVVQGKNLDVMEIDGASHTGVGEVRDLQESIGYVPSQFANKVYIIDEVHMLSTQAFNALLKTLEEPPAHVFFIFATTAPHKIPDTIKSRCQRHHFKRLEIGEITAQLESICKAEKVKYENEALRLLARKAEGSMRDGESLLDQCITASGGHIRTTSVRETLGLLDQAMVLEFLETASRRDATDMLRKLDDAVRTGVDLEELLNALIEGFRDLMLLASSRTLGELIFRSKEEIEALEGLLEGYELPDLVTIVERLCNVSPRLKMASDPRIMLESTLVDISMLDRQTDIRSLIEKLEQGGGETGKASPQRATRSPAPSKGRTKGEERSPRGESAGLRSTGAAGTAPPAGDGFPAPSTPAPAKPDTQAESGTTEAAPKDVDLSALDYASLRRLWSGFVTYVRQKKVALGVCLISGTIHSADGNVVMVRFTKGFNYQRSQVEDAKNAKFLKGMMRKYFGREMELVCFSEGEEAIAAKAKSKLAEEENATEGTGRRAIENQPMVRKILKDFDGEIVRYHPQ